MRFISLFALALVISAALTLAAPAPRNVSLNHFRFVNFSHSVLRHQGKKRKAIRQFDNK